MLFQTVKLIVKMFYKFAQKKREIIFLGAQKWEQKQKYFLFMSLSVWINLLSLHNNGGLCFVSFLVKRNVQHINRYPKLWLYW